MAKAGPALVGNTLYFGCRSAEKDQHYGSEWKEKSGEGNLVYRTAFSRDRREGEPRIYVQHLVREDAERIWELLETKGAWVYISGWVFLPYRWRLLRRGDTGPQIKCQQQ